MKLEMGLFRKEGDGSHATDALGLTFGLADMARRPLSHGYQRVRPLASSLPL